VKEVDLTMNKALIFGVAGQDGSYLAKLLLEKNYEVLGVEKEFIGDLWRFRKVGIEGAKGFNLKECDITDKKACDELLVSFQPDEIYNLAAQSSVALSIKDPAGTVDSTAFGAFNLFESIRTTCPKAKLFQASSTDMFGVHNGEDLKNEGSKFFPLSPYAVSKVFAHNMAVCYREVYGLHFSCGILCNHESPLRGDAFVTKKIAMAAAGIAKGSDEVLELGNMDACRDWGYAPEYVEAMHLMLQQDKGDDYVIGTGRLVSVRDFTALCFKSLGIDVRWEGSGLDEKGFDSVTGRLLVSVNREFFRPVDTAPYAGDPGKAERTLGWKATTGLEDLARIMTLDALEELS
jgi:GDPmannose 4,6-dehydratase